MLNCPHCGSELVVSHPLGPTCFVTRCPSCGHEGGGTIDIEIPDDPDANREVSGFFRLSRLDQFPALRKLLPSLASIPSVQIIRDLKANGLCWPLGPLTKRRAWLYNHEAMKSGLTFVVSED